MNRYFRLALVTTTLGYGALYAEAPAASTDAYLCSLGYTEYCATQDKIGGDELRASSPIVPMAISRRVSTFSRPAGFTPSRQSALDGTEGETGLSAGGSDEKSWWMSGNWTTFNNAHPQLDFDGDVKTLMIGLDKRIDDRTIWGVAFHTEDSEVHLKGTGVIAGKSGTGFAPYLAYTLNDTYTLDANVGAAWLSNSQTDGQDTNSMRFFGAVNFNGYWEMGNDWLLEGHAGWLHAHENFSSKATTTTRPVDVKMDQVNFWGQASYISGPYQPFFMAGYTHDITSPENYDAIVPANRPEVDHNNFVAGVGFNYYNPNGSMFSFELNSVGGRRDTDQTSVSASVRMPF